MDNKNLFTGAGGGPDAPHQTDDNLKSEDVVEFSLAISEGPIRGLEKGAKSFMVGDTPLVSISGVKNFDKFAIGVHPGYPEGVARPLDLKLGGVTSSTEVGVNLLQNTYVVRQALGALRGTIDQLEVRIQIGRLLRVDDGGGTFQNTASFILEYKQSASPTWLPFMNGNPVVSVYGKTTTGYTKEFRVDVPRIEDDDWEIRIMKISPDLDENNIVDLLWESFQCTNKTKLTYADTAIVHGLGIANGQFSSIPEFSGVYDGLIIRVPTNYNPDLRTYDQSTPWDGSFKFAWTNNPAWILYDLITNTRYGFAKHRRYIDANRFTFYEAAMWCDTMVPVGTTGTFRPRYTFNDVIMEPRPGMDMLQYVAGSFNALVWDDLQGQIHLRVDKDDPAVQVFTPENITEDGFSYTFTDITTRANDISVSFTNPDLDWVEDRRRIANITTSEADIEKYGRIPLDFIAVGCTNVHEAIAKAQVRLISSLTETTMVTFTTARQGALLSLFDVILVADPVMGWATTGRMTHYDSEYMYFRDPIYIESIKEYMVQVQSQTGLIEVPVQPEEIGHVTKLRTLTVLPDNLPRYAVFTLEEAGGYGFSKPFRVMNLEEVDGSPYVYRITAVEINRNKYVLSESATLITEPIYSYKQPTLPGNPTNFTADTGDNHVIITPSGEVIARIYTSWRKPFNTLVKSYELQYREVSEEAWTSIPTIQTEAYISPVKSGGIYALRVSSIDTSNNRSKWVTINNFAARGKNRIPVALADFDAKGGLWQNELNWVFAGTQTDILKTEIWGSNSGDFSTATILTDLSFPTNRWNHVGLDVGHRVYYWARIVDTSKNYSAFLGPINAVTISDPKLLMDILAGKITESELYVDLQDRITLIDGDDALPGSVNARVKEVKDFIEDTTLEIAEDILLLDSEIKQEVDDRVAAILNESQERVTFVQQYTYSKEESDMSESLMAQTVAAAKADAIAAGYADVRNYSYSKVDSDGSLSAMSDALTSSYKTYSDTNTSAALTAAAADVRNFAYSKTDVDGAIASQTSTLTTAYQGYADARLVDANNNLTQYAYSKSAVDSSLTSLGNSLTANYTTYADQKKAEAITSANATLTSYAYSKAGTDSAISTSANQLRSEFSSSGGATEAYVQNYAYSKATIDTSEAAQFNSLTANYTGYADAKKTEAINAASADVRNYSYSKAESNSAIASQVNQVTARLDSAGGAGVTVEQKLTSTANSVNGLSGQYTIKIDNNGYVTGFGLASTAINGVPTSSFIVNAASFSVAAPGLAPKVIFLVDASGAYMDKAMIRELEVTKITSGTIGSEWKITGAGGRIVFDNGSVMKVQGIGFGANSDLIEWFGPKMAITSCTKANATIYTATDGSAYYGGSLRAGTLYNAQQTTQTASNAEVPLGPYWSNGNLKTVVLSYSYDESRRSTTTDNGEYATDGASVSATIYLYKSFNGGVFNHVTTLSVTGSVNIANEPDGPDYAEQSMGGSLTITDAGPAGNYTYKAVLVSRSTAGFTHSTGGSTLAQVGQSIGIVSTEV